MNPDIERLQNQLKEGYSTSTKFSFDRQDPRFCVRKCPHCGEIWMLTDECIFNTYCGHRPSKSDTLKYRFSRKGEELCVSLNQEVVIQVAEKKIGCGKPFIFNDLPPLPPEFFEENFGFC